jgi:hypothetical protein
MLTKFARHEIFRIIMEFNKKNDLKTSKKKFIEAK